MSWECFLRFIGNPILAYWVQAIGGIATIWAAFLIGNKQIRVQNQNRKEEQQARLLAISLVIKNAAQNVSTFESLLKSDNSLAAVQENWKLIFSQMFKVSQRAISQLPSHKLGSLELVESFHSVAGCIDSIVVVVERSLANTAFQEQEFVYMCQDALIQCRVCSLSWKRFEQAFKEIYLSKTP